MYAVAGTQAQSANQNYIALMRLSDINQGRHGSKAGDEDDDDMSDSDDEGAPPQIHTSRVAHYGGVNRLRCMPQQPAVVASWGDTGLVQVCYHTSSCSPSSCYGQSQVVKAILTQLAVYCKHAQAVSLLKLSLSDLTLVPG